MARRTILHRQPGLALLYAGAAGQAPRVLATLAVDEAPSGLQPSLGHVTTLLFLASAQAQRGAATEAQARLAPRGAALPVQPMLIF